MTGSVAQAIAYANAQLGKPYLWGGESETNGFDCSGLVQSAYGVAGLGLPRTAAQQYAATSGQGVPAGQPLQVGDLVFFSKAGADAIHHVGIYVGNGLLLNAPHTGATVRIEPLSRFTDTYAVTRPLTDGASVAPATQTKGGILAAGSGVLSTAGNIAGTVASGTWQFLKDPIGTTESGVKTAAGAAAGAAASAALSGVQRYLVEGVILAGGVGLVGLGVYRGVKS